MKEDPYLDKAMRGWIMKTARKHYWRVARYLDLDDLIQDGFYCYAKCRARYKQFDVPEPTHDQRRQFMALVKATFINHITYRSNHSCSDEVLAEDVPEGAFASRDQIFQDGPLRALLAQAPQEVLDVLVLLATDASPLLRIGKLQVRETVNQQIARLLKLGPGDYVNEVAKYFS